MAGGVAKATCYDEVLEYKYSDTFRQAYAPDSRTSRESFSRYGWGSTLAFRLYILQNEKGRDKLVLFHFGGYGGSRTRVRKPLDMNFSVGS